MRVKSAKTLPHYLGKFCITQDYSQYTPRDQAVWRYIMAENAKFFREHAVDIYLDGLQKTGIRLDRIPAITEMDEKLQKYGWGAVAVCGFIPTAAFLEFQARGVLTIATGIRTLEHVGYTPAPDIVHEAAGHAPIIADPAYRAYLEKYGRMAEKAVMAKQDIQVYEAVRYLSDIKENPDTSPEEIKKAEYKLEEVTRNTKVVSEVTKLSRMAWWTIEYGLAGDLKKPKIYGAGLLSSVSESQNCLNSAVKKIPLTVECIEQAFDITKPQPQLFVVPSLDSLPDSLKDLEGMMAFSIGGIKSLEVIQKAQTINTVQLNSGVQISGELVKYRTHNGEACYLHFQGPSQISFADQELKGHSQARHPSGFGTPVGRVQELNHKDHGRLTKDDLTTANIIIGKNITLKMSGGIQVQGTLKNILFKNNFAIILTFTNCKVTQGDEVLFDPSWGEYDMALGDKVVSAFGGPADKTAFGDYEMGQAATSPTRQTPFTAQEKKYFAMYERLNSLRQSSSPSAVDLEYLEELTQTDFGGEWLLQHEAKEILASKKLKKII